MKAAAVCLVLSLAGISGAPTYTGDNQASGNLQPAQTNTLAAAKQNSSHIIMKTIKEPDPPLEVDPPLLCKDAEVQSPRDLSNGATGKLSSRGILPTGNPAAQAMVHVNTHFHLGAEHKVRGQYGLEAPADVNLNPTEEHELRPGWFCPDSLTNQGDMLKAYDFTSCKGVEVGNTYEIHSVWSTGGSKMADGLGGAMARTKNPFVTVQAQVFIPVNDPDDTYKVEDMASGWVTSLAEQDSVKYLGSTTGTSYNNEVCSPYQITWHVDKVCHLVSAKSLDQMCKDMAALGMVEDLQPHPSRQLVSPDFSATSVYAMTGV